MIGYTAWWKGLLEGVADMRARVICLVSAFALATTTAELTSGQRIPADAAGTSAIGNEAPIALAVSPLYPQTGMVAAVSVAVGGCSRACTHLWITHDRGATWHRAAAMPPGPVLIVAGTHHREELVAASTNAVVASDDDGATWHTIGPAGTPAAAGDAVLVAGDGSADYRLDAAGARYAVPGSAGTDVDLAFAPVPGGAGQNAALLAARDPATGLPVTLRCDSAYACSGAAALPGATPSSGNDMSLLPSGALGSGGAAYVRTSTMLYRSDDGGRSFFTLLLPAHARANYTRVPAAAVDGGPSHVLYVALLEVVGTGASQLTAGGVFASSDRGTTWRALGSPGVLDGGATAVAVAPGGRLFAGYVNAHGEAGLVCSDGGGAWQAACGAAATSCPALAGCGATSVTGVAADTPVAAKTGGNSSSGATAQRRPNRGTTLLTGGQLSVRTSSGFAVSVSAAALVVLLAAGGVSTRRRRRRRRCP
jgi:hypothetical protein